jgi:hypothetical protein
MPFRLVLAPFAAAAVLAQQPAAPAPTPAGKPVATVDAVLYSTRGDEKVHLLRLPDLAPLATYDAGAGAHELAISADGRFALGSAYGGPGKGHQPADNRVFVLDLPAGTRARMVDLGATKRPNDVAFLGAGTTAMVTTEAPPQLLRLDAATGTVEQFPLEHKANHMLALAPGAASCFVSHVMPGGITRFDVAAGKPAGYARLPDGAEGIACVARGEHVHVWVGCARSDVVAVVDGSTLAVLHELARPGFPFRVKASPDGARVAISCPKSGEVVIHDAADCKRAPAVVDVRAAADADVAPTSIAWSPDGKLVLAVVNGAQDRVVAIDAATAKVVAQVEAAGPIADALAAGRVQPPATVR